MKTEIDRFNADDKISDNTAIDIWGQNMSLEESSDMLCDDLLHEIAIGSVEGLLDESDSEELADDVPVTPEAISHFDSSFSNISQDYTPFGLAEHSTFGWTTDSYVIPAIREMPAEGSDITTVMLRNIPNKYTRAALLVALSEHGFDPATCNNLYLPMDMESGCNLGYAFLNFITHGHALEFKGRFDGCRLPSSGSRKICSVVWANKQGLFQFANAQAVPAPPPPPPMPQEVYDPQSQMRYHQLPPPMSSKIFIGGLPVSTTDEDLFNYFSKFGPVRECNIIVNRDTGMSRGFGFVDFMDPESVRIVDEAQQRRPYVVNCRVVSVRFYGAYSGLP